MAAISGIGAWYPETVRRNSDWPSDFGTRAARSKQRTFNDIQSPDDPALRVTEEFLRQEATDPFLGVRERRFAEETISAVESEVAAAQAALDDAHLEPSAIDCVISYSLVPDLPSPPTGCAVAHRLGMEGAMSWGLDATCASAPLQLRTACALVESGQANHVLLTQSHLISRSMPMEHPSSPGLGDAATAMIVSREGRWPVLATHAITHGDHFKSVSWVRDRDPENPDAQPAGWWNPGQGFKIGTRNIRGAKKLQQDTVAFGAQTIRELVTKAGVDLERINLLASAEPRGWIPRGILRVLGLDENLAASVYETKAHLGASGCVANLEQALREGKTENGGLGVMYAQGAGFTRAAVLLQLDGTPGAS